MGAGFEMALLEEDAAEFKMGTGRVGFGGVFEEVGGCPGGRKQLPREVAADRVVDVEEQ